MTTLQTIVLPEAGIGEDHKLFYRHDGPVGLKQSEGEIELGAGGHLSFNTFFNYFHLGKWLKVCDFSDLALHLEGKGRVELRVMLNRVGMGAENVFCDIVDLTDDTARNFDLTPILKEHGEGVIFFQIRAMEDGVVFRGGSFSTASEPQRTPKLAISITTFKREAEVRATVARLEDYIRAHDHKDDIRVQVVDNGKSAEIANSDITNAFENPNLGGAGGFARGLAEATDAGATHCLFMDDDASFYMENITRTYAALAYARDPKTAISGAMINTTVQWAMWEYGAVFEGKCWPLHMGTDLRNPHDLMQMEFNSLHDNAANRYGGWWFFAFPIAQAKHYPFPFFVRGDDISFSLANDFNITTLSGVVSFQEDFTEKESAQTLYLDLRNHLTHHLVFDQMIPRSGFKTGWIAVRFMMRSLLRFHYSTAEAQLLAWHDVMQGPDFYAENVDMSERRADIKALSADEAWKPVAEVDLSEQHKRLYRTSRFKRHYIGVLTLNGHLMPFWNKLGSKLVLRIWARANVFEAFCAKEVTYFNTKRDKAYTVRHSKARFYKIGWKMAVTLAKFIRGHKALQAQYRDRYDSLASREFWEKQE